MTITLRIAILDMNNGHPNESLRCIREAISTFETSEGFWFEYKIFDVRQAGELPDLSFDGYISTGGPGSPLPSGEEWEKKFGSFLDQLRAYNSDHSHRIKKPLFLICHSFQLACIHWKVARVNKRRSTSFGTFPVHLIKTSHHEPLLAGLDDPFWAVDSRDYQVVQPDIDAMERLGVKIICLEKVRAHVNLERAVMAIRFSEEIFGTQFHPEADAAGMLAHFKKEEKKKMIIQNYGQEKYDTIIGMLHDRDKISRTASVILPNFLTSLIRVHTENTVLQSAH